MGVWVDGVGLWGFGRIGWSCGGLGGWGGVVGVWVDKVELWGFE